MKKEPAQAFKVNFRFPTMFAIPNLFFNAIANYRRTTLVFALLLASFYMYAQLPLLYGLAAAGGANNSTGGTIFSVNGDGSNFTVKYNFSTNTGSTPFGSFTKASNGLLYGTTLNGGIYNYGTLFSFNPVTNTYADLHDFDNSDGANPSGSLLQANNGIFYGLTSSDQSGNGTLFSYNPFTSTFTDLASFNPNTGTNPAGSLIQASDGLLYGMTQNGGQMGNGTLFSFNIGTGVITDLMDFDYATEGANPSGNLIQANDGLLYGMNNTGGQNGNIGSGDGVLFSYSITNGTFTILYAFGPNEGDNPLGSLIQASNGVLYGLTANGGTNNLGVLFSYNLNSGTYTDLVNFDGSNTGSNPYCSLFQASNGLLYGTTEVGGSNGKGTVFSYNFNTGAYTVLHSMSSSDGYNPRGNLSEVFLPNVIWTGTTSTDWNTGSNWSTGTVPLATDSVIIPSSAPHQPEVTQNDTVNKISINSGATLTIAANGTLTVTGAIINAGSITVKNQGGFLQSDNSTYTGSGTFNVQNKLTNTHNGYRDLSSPVVGATVQQLANSFTVTGADGVDCWYSYTPYPNVQIYDETLNNLSNPTGNYYTGWVSFTGGSNLIKPMQGIAARIDISGTPPTITLTGTPNNGQQGCVIHNTPSATTSADGWNFVGNPYPSNIDWVSVYNLNHTNITGSYYVFETTGEYSGNWAACNSQGAVTNGNGLTGFNRYISPMQGFFIQSTSGFTAFKMNNTVRTTAASGGFYAHGPLANEVRLKLTDSINSDEILSYTDANATAGYDPALDAKKMAGGSTVYMSYNVEGIEYAINVMDDINGQTELPLVIESADTGNYTLTAEALNVMGYNTYLKDTTGGQAVLTDLGAGNATLHLNGGQVYNNYSIVFSAVDTAVSTGISNATTNSTRIYGYDNTVYVKRTGTGNAAITITDLLGQQIAAKETGDALSAITLNQLATQYIIVKVAEGDKVTTAKIFITNNE